MTTSNAKTNRLERSREEKAKDFALISLVWQDWRNSSNDDLTEEKVFSLGWLFAMLLRVKATICLLLDRRALNTTHEIYWLTFYDAKTDLPIIGNDQIVAFNLDGSTWRKLGTPRSLLSNYFVVEVGDSLKGDNQDA